MLDEIKTFEERKKELIKTFGSVTKMENASLEELTKILPEQVAISLQDYLKSRKEASEKNS